MRRFTFIICFSASVFCSNSQIIEQEYLFSRPVIIGDRHITDILIDGCVNKGINGHPLLPWKACNIVLPKGTQIDRIEVVAFQSDTLHINGIVAPAGYVRPISDYENRQTPLPDWNIYSKSIYYGQDYNQIKYRTHFLSSTPVLTFGICPVKYNPAEKKLIYYKKIEIKLYGTIGTDEWSLTEHDLFLFKSFVDNPETLPKAPPQSDDINKYHVLIITKSNFVENLKELQATYHSRGLKTDIVTTERIQNFYNGIDLAEKIRNCIKYYYRFKNLEYVVLAGDTEIIPTRKLKAVVQSSDIYTEYIPSDLYYSALDGNWDKNQNGEYGEPEEADLFPEISIGRIPFSNITELNNFITKIKRYAFSPVSSDTNRPLLVGEHLWDNPLTWGAQYLDLIVGSQSSNGYTTQGISPLDPYDSLYDRNQFWTATQLRNRINQGSSFIHHVGHANYDYLMRLYLSDLTDNFFAPINGISRLNPLIYSHGCLAGAFDENDCIAERMILMPNFASGFIGNSRYGWFNEGQTEGPSAHLHREFVHALYGLGAHFLGLAHQISQLRSAAWVDLPFEHEPGAQRWAFYACNVLGDPATPVWTSLPSSPQFSVVGNVFAGDNALLIVNNENASNLTVSLIDKHDNFYGSKAFKKDTVEMKFYPTVRVPDTLFLISSGRNIDPDTVPVVFLQPTQPTLVYDGYHIQGTQQNFAVSGKVSEMTIKIKNVGLTKANFCKAVVSSVTNGVQVEGVELLFGDVEANQTVTASQPIEFYVPTTINDNENIMFQIDIITENNIHCSDFFHVPVYAPVLFVGDPIWSDRYGGNGNEIVEKGEVVSINIPIDNLGGVHTDSLTATLSLLSGNCNLINPQIKSGPMPPFQPHTLTFLIQVDIDSPLGDTIQAKLTLFDGINEKTKILTTRANLPVEEFGESTFSLPIWTNNSTKPWVFSDQGLDGGYCMKSGAIGNAEHTQISTTITLSEPDYVSFWFKVSCENSDTPEFYDYLEFVVDNNRRGIWDNKTKWTKATFLLSEGTHNLIWRYKKDYSGSSGADAAWIDRIVFPPVIDIPVINNFKPTIFGLADTTLQSGKHFTIPFTVIDNDNDPITVTLFNNPHWIALDGTNNQYRLSGITPSDDEAEFNFQVVATDGKQADVGNIKITTANNTLIFSETSLKNVTIYPNPTSTNFVLSELPPSLSGVVTIVDPKGVVVYNKKHNSDIQGKIIIKKFGNIDLKGVYLLNYQFGNCRGTTVLLID